jgi:hypothetical protein
MIVRRKGGCGPAWARAALVILSIVAAAGLAYSPTSASPIYTLSPVADGTIVDGGPYGPFDGIPDHWDWIFNQSGYEGAITLTDGENAIEHRLVWEYDLGGVDLEGPIAARLVFTLRGAPIFPFPDTVVHVYAYPANLQENTSDYFATPATFQGAVRLQAFQAPTLFAIDVSGAVNSIALDPSGASRVAFRFQIDPATENSASQAFLDADDDEPLTKPYLRLFPAGSTLSGK